MRLNYKVFIIIILCSLFSLFSLIFIIFFIESNLEDIDFQFISPYLLDIKKLSILDCNSNNLTNKSLIKLSENFSNLTCLERLYFGRNECTSDGIIKFSDNISHLPNLHSLILFSNEIGESANYLLENLSCCTNLRILSLSFTKLIDSSISSFPFLTHYIKYLEILYLNENEITDEGLEYFIPNISGLKHLKIFELRDNLITERGAEKLINVIEENNLVNLDQLMFLGNPINTINNPELLELIKKRNKDYIGIEEMLRMIESNEYDYEKIKYQLSVSYKIYENVIELFNRTKNEKCFDLITLIAMNYFGKHKEKMLQFMNLKDDYLRLRYCNSIRSNLFFGCDSMGYNEKDAEFICKHITSLEKLDSLSVEYSLLGDKALSDILYCLVNSSKLTSLYLASNNLTSKFVPALVNLMNSSTILRCLIMFINRVDDNGLKEISDSFSHTTTLQILSLGCNAFSYKGMEYLAQNLSYLSSLEELYINENNIGDAGISAISDQFSCITQLKNFNFDSIYLYFLFLFV